ncbi:MAG: OmpA family protein [Aquificaceae bacterium]|nr:OmpA family protein [Aquificaceae bacterium]MDW8032784.1 OmpA family protein [Aquificaceae bacterium]
MEGAMKKISLILLTSTVVLAQDFSGTRLLEGINQLWRNLELAGRGEVELKDIYHFEKARANKDVSYSLASGLDEVGARVFMVKGFGALSKALSGRGELDRIDFLPEGEDRKVRRVEYGEYGEALTSEEEGSSRASGEYERSLGIDLKNLNSNLRYLRENRALNCAPIELARAEVYYDALAYELRKSKPNANNLLEFYRKSWTEISKALEKVQIAREGQLECYTGKPFVAELTKAKEEVSAAPRLEPPPQPALQEEPLMITARVHFDFDKHQIKKEYLPFLEEVVKTLKENPNVRVRIEGFTDHVGSKAYNDRLALRRAQAVKEYLVRAGIPADRIEVRGFGKERYVADNRTPVGRLTNRRAEFILIQVPGQ